MGKQINFFGYSLWIADDTQQKSDPKIPTTQYLYSPSVLAAYCIFTNLFIAIILYGINIFRRGYLWRGRLFIASSGFLLICSIFSPSLSQLMPMPWSLLSFNTLVAVSLYTAEKPHFKRAIRNGAKPARWWLPLIWIAAILGTLLLLEWYLQI